MIDKTELMMQSMSNDIRELNEKMMFFEAMFSQLLMALGEAGIIQLDDEPQEGSPEEAHSPLIIP